MKLPGTVLFLTQDIILIKMAGYHSTRMSVSESISEYKQLKLYNCFIQSQEWRCDECHKFH